MPSPRPMSSKCARSLPTAASAFGRLFHRTGDRAKAAEHLTIAATIYREMHMGCRLQKAEAELGPSQESL